MDILSENVGCYPAFFFSFFHLLILRSRGTIVHHGKRDQIGEGSALYQLMGIRINGITNSDEEYQEIIRKSDGYSCRREEMALPEEVRLLINRYVSKQNALGSRYGMLTYLLGFSDCKEMLLKKHLFVEP